MSIVKIQNQSIRVLTLWVLGWICMAVCASTGKVIDVRKRGVDANGLKLQTKILQSLIDELSRSPKGGTLYFPPGVYLTGSLQLRSNVELHLLKGAVLLGSTNPYDYVFWNSSSDGRVDENTSSALLMGKNLTNISLKGEGTIDGRGLELALTIDSLHHIGERIDPLYNTRRMRPTMRPKLFFFSESNDIRVEGLHLRSSSGWGLSFDRCRTLDIRNIDLVNRAYWNNDGIDISDCRSVNISGCRIDAADDGICLKSHTATEMNEDVHIADCDITSSASAVKLGTASYGGFRNITVRNIRVKDTFRSAIALETVDGGVLENILVDGVKAVNTGNAIFMRLGHRSGSKPGVLRHVVIRNMEVQIPFGRPDLNYDLRGPEPDFFHNPFPCVISGIPGHRIEDVRLEQISISFPGRASKSMAYVGLYRAKAVPEAIEAYPEFTMFGELPAWAFYLRHVKGITFSNVDVRLNGPDFRPAVLMHDVLDANTSGLPAGLQHASQIVEVH